MPNSTVHPREQTNNFKRTRRKVYDENKEFYFFKPRQIRFSHALGRKTNAKLSRKSKFVPKLSPTEIKNFKRVVREGTFHWDMCYLTRNLANSYSCVEKIVELQKKNINRSSVNCAKPVQLAQSKSKCPSAVNSNCANVSSYNTRSSSNIDQKVGYFQSIQQKLVAENVSLVGSSLLKQKSGSKVNRLKKATETLSFVDSGLASLETNAFFTKFGEPQTIDKDSLSVDSCFHLHVWRSTLDCVRKNNDDVTVTGGDVIDLWNDTVTLCNQSRLPRTAEECSVVAVAGRSNVISVASRTAMEKPSVVASPFDFVDEESRVEPRRLPSFASARLNAMDRTINRVISLNNKASKENVVFNDKRQLPPIREHDNVEVRQIDCSVVETKERLTVYHVEADVDPLMLRFLDDVERKYKTSLNRKVKKRSYRRLIVGDVTTDDDESAASDDDQTVTVVNIF